MYIMAVLISHDFYNSHFPVMEHKLPCQKTVVKFDGEVEGLLKM